MLTSEGQQCRTAGGAATVSITLLSALKLQPGITTTFVGAADAGHDNGSDAAFTNNITVNLDADGDANVIDASAYTGTLTVTADDIDIDNNGVGGNHYWWYWWWRFKSHLVLVLMRLHSLLTTSPKFRLSSSLKLLIPATASTSLLSRHLSSATVYDTLTVDGLHCLA